MSKYTIIDAIGNSLSSKARLADGREVLGQSLSYVASSVRDGRFFRFPSRYYLQVHLLTLCGFEVRRGRMKNSYREGYGKECDVVIAKDPSRTYVEKPARTIPLSALEPRDAR